MPNVIAVADQVTSKDRTAVLDWVNASLAPASQRTSLQCLHYAAYQMHQA